MSELAPINDLNLKIFDEICEERFNSIDLNAVLVAIVDNLPSEALPHLAWQYHITGNEGWLQADTDEKKRKLIKAAIEIHRYKGTPYAIKKVLETVNVSGKISEWFEFEGEPYTFKIHLNVVNDYISEDKILALIELIDEYKNVRSHLIGFEEQATYRPDLNFAAFCYAKETVIVHPQKEN